MRYEATTRVAGFDFKFACEVNDGTAVKIDLHSWPVEKSSDSFLISAVIKEASGADFDLRSLEISWSVPLIDMHGLYFGGNPGEELSRLPFWWIKRQVSANSGVPYINLIHRNGESRAAFGLLDQLTETVLSATLSEASRSYDFTVQKPATQDKGAAAVRVHGQWQERLFVSTSRRPWPDVLKSYVAAVDRVTVQPKLPVPDCAYDPVFCSWTAIHHDVSADWIMHNAKVAAELGFKTWITDDGWFQAKGQFADYSFAGDWQPYPPKFPDMAAHVKAIQQLGFRYVLWVSPFMVGKASQTFKDLAHLLTPGSARLNFDNLAPWLPEVQQHIADTLERVVMDYGLDGLKLDFIDAVKPYRDNPDGVAENSVGQSIYTTLKVAVDRLAALKPDILIEFRNTYANLASRAYANIYRSSDVPINFTLNRWQAVLLRLLTPDRAIHLDPMLWHRDEKDENVAVHLINCIVSVPMTGIELDQYPASHIDLIRCWIGFYNDHRDTIIHGDFKPTLAYGHIPLIHFVGRAETIIGVYEDVPVTLDPPTTKVWLLNASTRPYIDLETNGLAVCEVTIHDKFGRVVAKQQMPLTSSHLKVEVGGSIELDPC